MNDTILTELKIIVERCVRPLRASDDRKRRMREELLDHLTAIFEEERKLHSDEHFTLKRARERFGEPEDLMAELQATVSRWDRGCAIFDKLRFNPGQPLWIQFSKYFSVMFVTFTLMTCLMIPISWIRDGLDEIGIVLHVALVMSATIAALTFAFTFLIERIRQAMYESKAKYKRWAVTIYGLASLGVFPVITWLAYWGFLGEFNASLDGLFLGCAFAPVLPLFFVLLARVEEKQVRQDREWASLEINE